MKIDPKDPKKSENFQEYFNLAFDKTKKNKLFLFLEQVKTKSPKYTKFKSIMLTTFGNSLFALIIVQY
jgi:hypothetical protein